MAGMLTEAAKAQQVRVDDPIDLLHSRVIIINMACVGLFDTAPQPTGTHPASQSETTAMTVKENVMFTRLATPIAVPPAHADTAPDALLAGALDHLLRYALTGCNHSARHAAYLLDHLAERPDVCGDLRANCERMSGALAAPDFVAAWRRSH